MRERRASAEPLRRLVLILLFPLVLAACAAPRQWAQEEDVQRALHPAGGPPQITLYTVVNNRTGAGDHSSLVVNGDHRVLYDPAGTWFHRTAPRRNDVHYGLSRSLEQVYLGYHARETHHVVAQTIPVTLAQANAALRAAEGQSPAGAGQCAVRTSGILRDIRGLDHLPRSWFPRTLMEALQEVPGVETRRIQPQDLPPGVLVQSEPDTDPAEPRAALGQTRAGQQRQAAQ